MSCHLAQRDERANGDNERCRYPPQDAFDECKCTVCVEMIPSHCRDGRHSSMYCSVRLESQNDTVVRSDMADLCPRPHAAGSPSRERAQVKYPVLAWLKLA